jgi:hypothetical protein
MNLKLTSAFVGIALAASVAFTSFVPVASAQDVPPMIGPAMRFLQSLEQQLKALSATVAGFAESFTTSDLTFSNGEGGRLTVQSLCIGNTCVDEAQLQTLLATQNASAIQDTAVSNTDATTATTTILESPIIQINGDNPAIIHVGAAYNDLGATITGPQDDLNLGIQTYVNGAAMSPVVIDTSVATTNAIDYVATDQTGLTSTSTRVVIVEASPSIIPADEASTTATSTTQ